MIFRLMIILVVYQLAFVGVSIFYFGDFEQVVSLIAFLTSLLLLGFIVDPRAKVLGLNERIRQDTTNSGLIFFIGILGVLFLVLKFLLFGVPLFAADANFFRVEFARKLDFVSGITRHLCYVCIVVLVLKSAQRYLLILSFAMCVIGVLSGYRSAAVLPIVLIIFVKFLIWDRGLTRYFQIHFKLIFVLVPLCIAALAAVTAARFGDISDIPSSLGLLSDRIFFHNYRNVVRVEEQFLDSPLYLESLFWDLRSIFSQQLGFSGVMSKLSGSGNYELVQMTPTFVGEGIANFGRHYYLHGFLIVFVTYLIRVVLVSVRTNIGIGGVLLVFAFLPISSGQGFGTYLFAFLPKLVISCFLVFALYQAIPKATANKTKRFLVPPSFETIIRKI